MHDGVDRGRWDGSAVTGTHQRNTEVVDVPPEKKLQIGWSVRRDDHPSNPSTDHSRPERLHVGTQQDDTTILPHTYISVWR